MAANSKFTKKITLEDVEAAITILETYLKHVDRARRVLSKLRAYEKYYGLSPTKMLELYLAESLARGIRLPSEIQPREEEEIRSDEEVEAALERLRKLASKEEAIEQKQ
jgi:hypothetical protein